jgi:hypothetical protein
MQTGICAKLEGVRCYQTIHANETKEKCKPYEISVTLNDPWSVSDNPGYYLPLTTSNLANGMSVTKFI